MLRKPLHACSASLPPFLCPLLNPSLREGHSNTTITGWAAFRHARAFHASTTKKAAEAVVRRAAPLTAEQEHAYLARLRQRSSPNKSKPPPPPPKLSTIRPVPKTFDYDIIEPPIIDDLEAPESQVQLEDDLIHDVGTSFADSSTLSLATGPDLAAVQDLIDQSFTDTRRSPKLNTSSLSRYDWRLRATSRLGTDERQRLEQAGLLKRKHRKQPRFKRLMRGDEWFPEVSAYTDRFFKLMEAEQEAETAALKLRLEKPTNQLVADGYAVDELWGRWEDKFEFGKPVATFFRSRNRYMRWNRLEPGATVIISKTSFDVDGIKRKDAFPGQPKGDELLTGSVLRKDERVMSIAFEGKFDELEQQNIQWRLDLWTSDIVLKRMRDAIRRLNLDPAAQEMQPPAASPFQQIANSVAVDDVLPFDVDAQGPERAPIERENMLVGTQLRDIIVASSGTAHMSQAGLGAFADNQHLLSWCRRQLSLRDNSIVAPGDPDVKLNRSQLQAIALMLSQRASLIQGPPGTGKTRTIVEAVYLLKMHWQMPHPILVCAHTNTAVDNLARGIVDRTFTHAKPLKVLRLGALSRICEDLHDQSLDAYLARHPRYPSLRKKRQQLALLGKGEDTLEKRTLRFAVFGIERNMMRDILDEIDVVCTTCISSASRALEVTDFPIVFIDEASMATEPAALIPLMKGSKHVAIIGDHKQLPPVIVSVQAQEGGLAVSLFERLVREGQIPSIMLDTQYRMHPAISAFPSKAIYDSALKDGTLGSALVPPETEYLPGRPGLRAPMAWISHGHGEAPRSRSLENEGEAQICADVVADLLAKNPDLTGSEIGIITPYNAQIAKIQHVLHADQRNLQVLADYLGQDRAKQVEEIEIKTVDGFEGREKKVIIFSAVRCNVDCDIGFMADSRRLNVALTRAKNALIVIGNEDTFAHAVSTTARGSGSAGAHLWRDLINHFKQQQAIIRHASYTVPRPRNEVPIEGVEDVEEEVVDVAAHV